MKRNILIVASIVWLAVMLFGFKLVFDYDWKASTSGSTSTLWPSTCQINRAKDRWTLVMAVHRQCPCTRASINELNKIMTKCAGRLQAALLIYRPSGEQFVAFGDSTSDAIGMTNVERVDDANAAKADLFNATTSGECFLYNPEGLLCFHGGITGSRGHEGDNGGEDSVVALVNGEISGFQKSPYFGCSIH
ncbi:MAG TPA: hypothetical protein V6C81_10340 [Planktothrix sp.]|jgi:hypothetical protein